MLLLGVAAGGYCWWLLLLVVAAGGCCWWWGTGVTPGGCRLWGIAAPADVCCCHGCCLLPAFPVLLQVLRLWEALWAGEPGLHLYMCLAVLEHHRRRILR